jgi:iron complex transport system ATP-binding protein
MSEAQDRSISTYSKGMRQRIKMASSLVHDPAVLLLDEPTAALDLQHQELVMGVARARARKGTAVVVVAHDLALAAAWADRIVVLEAGRLVADGPPRDILSEELLSQVYGTPVEVLPHPTTGIPIILPRRDRGV